MKKILSFALAAALIVTTAFMGMTPAVANAASKDKEKKVLKALNLDESKAAKYKEGEALVLTKGDFSAKSKRSALKKSIGAGSDLEIVDAWAFDTPGGKSRLAAKTLSKAAAKEKNLTITRVRSKSLSTKKLVRQLNEKDAVELAEPNYTCRALGDNGTYYDQQWALKNSGQNGGTPGQDIRVESKWSKGVKGSDETVVAIIDSGVDYDHPDLKKNMWENPYAATLPGEHGYNFVKGTGDPMDDDGHGTHCAGIIGAAGTSQSGVSGVNKDVKIMALKFLDEEGFGDISGAVAAYGYINRAMDKGVKVTAVNDSWGGGEESKLLGIVMDAVGEKGAVSICAAGNDGTEETAEDGSPANSGSQYSISVAASTEKGQLASFSNFGKDHVDLAAPGADILSTVAYPCFNPTLYQDSKLRGELCNQINDYEGSESWAGKDKIEVKQVADGKLESASNVAVSIDAKESFGKAGGKSLKVAVDKASAGDMFEIELPYTIPGVKKETPRLSAMVKVSGPKATDFIEFFGTKITIPSYLNITDLASDEEITSSEALEARDYGLAEIDGTADYWNHLTATSSAEVKNDKQSRKLVLILECAYSGDYEINIDDLAVSNADVTDQFGKYDFYNGTSMAAPYVTGAAALFKSENKGASGDELMDMLLNSVKKEDALKEKVASGGVLDLSTDLSVAAPRISGATVDVSKKTIKITGNRLKGATVKINNTDVKPISTADKEIVIPAENWINKMVDITVTGGGKSTTKKGIYLVKGKKAYTKMNNVTGGLESPITALATDGKVLYGAFSGEDALCVYNPADGKYASMEPIMMVDSNQLFKNAGADWSESDFTFSQDLVYLDGKLYNIGAMSEVVYPDQGEADWEDMIIAAPYATEYGLLCMDPSTGKTTGLGQLPKDIQNTANWTVASYNGKLYVMGGYDYTKKALSRVVKVYDPATKKWSGGPSLPEGRASGKAIQSGNRLVYTLGYTEGGKDTASCPANLIFDGKTWKKAAKSIKPYNPKTTTISKKEYTLYQGSVGLCGGGLMYTGIPAEGLGDTFTYNVSKDTYQPTDYNYITDVKKGAFDGIVVGNTMYGFGDDRDLYKVPASSGLVKVSAGKLTGGSIKGANTGYLPGSKVTLTASASSGYFLKSFTVAGKKISGKSVSLRLTENKTASASFGQYVSKIKLNKKSVTLKAGKSFKLKATVSPSGASNKKVTFKSSNKKYATVTSKGVVKAKKAGIGKTVKITVTAKDGSKKKAVCKVKIKK